jgi:hypothetical protein
MALNKNQPTLSNPKVMAKRVAKRAAGWEASHLQAIFFPLASPRAIQQDWFRDLTGVAPDQSLATQHEAVQIGQCGNCMLHVEANLLKVALTLMPKADPDSTEMIATLDGTVPDSVASILDLAGHWIDIARLPIKRIGFAGRLIQRIKNKATGYRILKQFLPTVRLDSSSSDLMFRINRPRVLRSIAGRSVLNRLSTWTLAKHMRMAATVGSGAAAVSAPTAEAFSTCLEFDMNTDGERTEALPQNKLKRILKELSDAAIEISKRGDVR